MTYPREAPRTVVITYEDSCVIKVPFTTQKILDDFLEGQDDVVDVSIVPYNSTEIV